MGTKIRIVSVARHVSGEGAKAQVRGLRVSVGVVSLSHFLTVTHLSSHMLGKDGKRAGQRHDHLREARIGPARLTFASSPCILVTDVKKYRGYWTGVDLEK